MSIDFDLALFVAIVDHEGFQTAASLFDMPRSTASKRITRLEGRLGVRLLNRNSRSLSLTPAGRIYYRHAKEALDRLREAEETVRAMSEQPTGIMRVTCAVMIGINAIIPRLPEFHRAYPDVRLELSLSDTFVDLVAAGFDVGIRMGNLPDSSLVARRIMSARRIICASPAYLETFGAPQDPGDLAAHNCLNLLTLGQTTNEWTFFRDGGPDQVRVTGNFATDSGAAHYAAIVAGIGIGRVTHLRALTDLENGRLVRLLGPYEMPDDHPIYAVVPSNRNMLPAVRAFIDFLARGPS